MTIQDFNLERGNHFIAMEYYALMLNRTFMVVLAPNFLLGIKINGLISVKGGKDPITRAITAAMAVEDMNNPYAYGRGKYLTEIQALDFASEEILQKNKGNFRIPYRDITGIEHDPSKKWGMGPYPHDGKIYICTKDGKKKELILLGNQDGAEIAASILIRTPRF